VTPDTPEPAPGARPAPRSRRARPEPGRRGGHRPGAGAPRGNTNALKHGVYSPRHLNAAVLIAVIPDLQVYIQRLLRADRDDARRKHAHIMAVARYALLNHPALEGSIKQYVIYKLSAAAAELNYATPIFDLLRELSNNQSLVGPMEDLQARRWYAEGLADLHPDIDYLLDVLKDLSRARQKKAIHDRPR
jgi:hypothetical protein